MKQTHYYRQIGRDHGPAVQIQADRLVLRVIDADTGEPTYIGFSDEQWFDLCALCADFTRMATS